MTRCSGFAVSGLILLLFAPAAAQDKTQPGRASTATRPATGNQSKAKVEFTGNAVQLPLVPEYAIGTEDVLAINVWKEPEISRTVPVRPDGKVSVPLIGEVQAKGLTPKELQSKIQHELQAYLSNPEVAVIVQEVRSQKFNILGEVARPGSYPLVKPMTILDALAVAGGFQDFAKVTKIFLLRTRSDGSRAKIPFNYKDVVHGNRFDQNIELQPYDTIIVP